MLEFSEDLSPRQQDVFDLMILGYSNNRIGELLFITPYTVKQHVYQIMQKCGIGDRMTMTLLHYELPTWMDAEND